MSNGTDDWRLTAKEDQLSKQKWEVRSERKAHLLILIHTHSWILVLNIFIHFTFYSLHFPAFPIFEWTFDLPIPFSNSFQSINNIYQHRISHQIPLFRHGYTVQFNRWWEKLFRLYRKLYYLVSPLFQVCFNHLSTLFTPFIIVV